MGVRIALKRRLDWNVLGSLWTGAAAGAGMEMEDAEEEWERTTWVQLQLSGLTVRPSPPCRGGEGNVDDTVLNSVTLEAALERFYESARITLARERVCFGSRNE